MDAGGFFVLGIIFFRNSCNVYEELLSSLSTLYGIYSPTWGANDPYDFAFTGITGKYNEALLKDKLLGNITQFLVELGTGFGYLGKEYRLKVGEREQFIDLLFYNLNLSCYVVIEVKIGKFEFADLGQLGGYY